MGDRRSSTHFNGVLEIGRISSQANQFDDAALALHSQFRPQP